jgi:hypothetical protein
MSKIQEKLILDKYVEKIKEINSCGADAIMDSVWENILINFFKELSEINNN